MLTVFAIPKPFRGFFANIQRNAIRSWVALRPKPEIILFGDDEGTREVARELGCLHVPEVGRNEYGTPLVDSLFAEAERAAHYPLLCYVNADIILMSDFSHAVEQVSRLRHPFLLVSHRRDVDLRELWDFSRADWEKELRSYVTQHGIPLKIGSSDYFVFPRGFYKEIPPFAIGRGAWDNWLIYKACSMGVPVIDATQVVMAVHHSHDFCDGPRFTGTEAQTNNQLYGRHPCYGLNDATHKLTRRGLRRAWGWDNIISRLNKVRTTKALLDLAVEARRLWREGPAR